MKGFALVNQYAPFAIIVQIAILIYYKIGIFFPRAYQCVAPDYPSFQKFTCSLFKLLFSHKKSLLLVGIYHASPKVPQIQKIARGLAKVGARFNEVHPS